jgi:D-glycero-D-manno-heptose 1,7-bisphosphate phosphatase
MKPAVFLDRDGVLIEEKHYLHDPDGVALIPGAGPALKQLMDHGFLLLIVTNQAGVGRGYFTMDDVHRVHERMRSEYRKSGVEFTRIYVAPEAPDQPNRGRKPSPRFLLEARDEYGIDLGQSYMIGDKMIDLECGWNAGVKQSVLVRTGYGAKTEVESALVLADKRAWVLDDLPAAARKILDLA